MANHYSTAEKGKGLASSSAITPPKRIRAPEFDYSDLVKDNAKTLIGRLTNPKEQKNIMASTGSPQEMVS